MTVKTSAMPGRSSERRAFPDMSTRNPVHALNDHTQPAQPSYSRPPGPNETTSNESKAGGSGGSSSALTHAFTRLNSRTSTPWLGESTRRSRVSS